MKMLLQSLILLSLFTSMPAWPMNYTGTDIESSESDSDSDVDLEGNQEAYMRLDEPGAYWAFFSLRAVNKSKENAKLAIAIYINNKKDKQKEYSIAPDSILAIEDFIPVTTGEDDLIQIKLNAPTSVDIESSEIDFITPVSKTKL